MEENNNHLKESIYLTDVLFFSAHPDDAEFACGGTMLKLAKNHGVVNVILTRGEAGTFGNPETREKEAHAAALFGKYSVEFLDFRDNFVDDNAENAHKLAQIIRKYKPKVVFAPYHTNPSSHVDGISHPDHLNTGRLVVKAARFAKFKNAKLEGEAHSVKHLLYFMIPRFSKPSFVVDVSDVVQDLPKLWACHESQFKNLAKGKAEERFLLNRKVLAQSVQNVEYAEGFLADEVLKLDLDFLVR
jgi:LmbE family N-acetylglucosaminyl deacetylase